MCSVLQSGFSVTVARHTAGSHRALGLSPLCYCGLCPWQSPQPVSFCPCLFSQSCSDRKDGGPVSVPLSCLHHIALPTGAELVTILCPQGQCLFEQCSFQEALKYFVQASKLQPQQACFRYRWWVSCPAPLCPTFPSSHSPDDTALCPRP